MNLPFRIRHLALSFLHEDKTETGGMTTKRAVALRDDDYLARILHLDVAAQAV